MILIPTPVVNFIARHRGMSRNDIEAVERQLRHLGIPGDSLVGKFYKSYELPLSQRRFTPRLLDPVDPHPTVTEETEYVRKRFQLPDFYIAIASTEGENFILYDKRTSSVIDAGFEDIDKLLAGQMEPRWQSFEEFLLYFFSEDGDAS